MPSAKPYSRTLHSVIRLLNSAREIIFKIFCDTFSTFSCEDEKVSTLFQLFSCEDEKVSTLFQLFHVRTKKCRHFFNIFV